MTGEATESKLESTHELVQRAKAGDGRSLDQLFTRYRPRLREWAHGRLPRHARGLADTDDLVQQTMLKVVRNFKQFTPDHPEGFNHYLRLTIHNAVRDEIRRARRQPTREELDSRHPGHDRSPLEEMIDSRRIRRYESALAQLSTVERDAVVARIEFGFTHGELAAALGKRTPDTARKVFQKAMAKLLVLMQPVDQKG
jgi:RNA polymerase sigma factor (sigma-70 family)